MLLFYVVYCLLSLSYSNYFFVAAKKVRTAPSVGCASQLPYDDDEFVEGPVPFLARMQQDPLCDAPDTDLIAEEREKFPTVRVRVPPWLTIEPHFIFRKNFVVIFEL